MATKKTKKKTVKAIPKGFRSVTASMNVNNAGAMITFCKKAFGGKLLQKMALPNGKIMHATVQIGDSVVMVADAVREPVQLATLCLYVESVDKTVAKAVKAGATLNTPAADMFWGDRFARITDPEGNRWAIARQIEIVKADELKKRMKAAIKQMGG